MYGSVVSWKKPLPLIQEMFQEIIIDVVQYNVLPVSISCTSKSVSAPKCAICTLLLNSLAEWSIEF